MRMTLIGDASRLLRLLLKIAYNVVLQGYGAAGRRELPAASPRDFMGAMARLSGRGGLPAKL